MRAVPVLVTRRTMPVGRHLIDAIAETLRRSLRCRRLGRATVAGFSGHDARRWQRQAGPRLARAVFHGKPKIAAGRREPHRLKIARGELHPDVALVPPASTQCGRLARRHRRGDPPPPPGRSRSAPRPARPQACCTWRRTAACAAPVMFPVAALSRRHCADTDDPAIPMERLASDRVRPGGLETQKDSGPVRSGLPTTAPRCRRCVPRRRGSVRREDHRRDDSLVCLRSPTALDPARCGQRDVLGEGGRFFDTTSPLSPRLRACFPAPQPARRETTGRSAFGPSRSGMFHGKPQDRASSRGPPGVPRSSSHGQRVGGRRKAETARDTAARTDPTGPTRLAAQPGRRRGGW